MIGKAVDDVLNGGVENGAMDRGTCDVYSVLTQGDQAASRAGSDFFEVCKRGSADITNPIDDAGFALGKDMIRITLNVGRKLNPFRNVS
ncbi:hypothetical protein PARPLA_02290 [Rhodobacteraceae bacterium THAF1]|uniref:hypothetical protein n=1 Tax=Palleronia sp. THAF1 TaxID=2587842 RepID=UPI000F40CA5F|nr:hypothetical protein [Palleronia sp. THAF1]QFU09324.1 hypothetical protein FIU81_11630 [Palleronia sp. THAF1]VDC26757.1 hypothetical protein PARPLA_02290 [Rhodobacteraceae bacterium THAF1]